MQLTPCLVIFMMICTLRPSLASDPCSNVTFVDEDFRSVTNSRVSSDNCDNETFSPQLWYSFRSAGKNATIPTTCIKNDRCGAKIGMRVELEGQTLPSAAGENITAVLCGSYSVLGKYDCCVLRSSVEIAWCDGGHLVYRFPEKFDRCPVAICTTAQDDTVPAHVLVKHGEAISKQSEPDEKESQISQEDENILDSAGNKDDPETTDKASGTTDLQETSSILVSSASSESSFTFQENETTEQSLVTTEVSSVATTHTGQPSTTLASDSPDQTADISSADTSLVTQTPIGFVFTENTTKADNATADHGMDSTLASLTSSPDQENDTETSASTVSGIDMTTSVETYSISHVTSSNSDSDLNVTSLMTAENTTNMDNQSIEFTNTSTMRASVASISDLPTASSNSDEYETDSSSSLTPLLTTQSISTLTSQAVMSTEDLGFISESDSSNDSVTSELPNSDRELASSGVPSTEPTLTIETSTESSTEVTPEESTVHLVPLSIASTTAGLESTPSPEDSTREALPSTSITDSTTFVSETPTSLSTSNTTDTDTPTSDASLTSENTPATPPHASSSAGEDASQTTSDTSASPTSPAVQPTSSSTQDQESSEIPSKLYPSSSVPDTITQTKDSPEGNHSDFGFNEDVILVEKVRLVFKGNYENDSIFLTKVDDTLSKFLLAATRLKKSKAGTDWWFKLELLGQPELYRNRSTIVDFRIKHTSGEEILETFKHYQLKKYFKDQVDLSLLAECRPTKNCQEFSAVSSPINKSHFWAEHAPVFLTVLVLSTVIFLVLLVGFLGGKCRDRWWRTGNYDAARDDYEAYDTKPLSGETKLRPVSGVSGGMSSPFSDAQITTNEVDADLNQNEQETAFTTNEDAVDGGVDDNTWVIPLEEAPQHPGNGHTEPVTTSVPTTTSTTTTIQGRNDAFVSTRF
ncbi:hypothetical protein RRG08_015691 [Elysia crispata]|uniref:Uncharacterized protein n=1 Tax=Elysia crispata TaxID=231223 RepID=A0AAE1CRM9_9GAST|nr:hypothetical protein RRG08_015691 [Elysia crispata]